jgi:hypothetical protein
VIPRRFAEHAKYLKKLGVDLLGVNFTGKTHVKMQVARGVNRRFFIVSNTPSDRRSFLNWQGDIRKWLTQTSKEDTNAD